MYSSSDSDVLNGLLALIAALIGAALVFFFILLPTWSRLSEGLQPLLALVQ